MNVSVSLVTAEGGFVAELSERGLAGLRFPQTGGRATQASRPLTARQQQWAEQTARALEDALAGRTPPGLPPLDESGGTEFQRQVWAALRAIPCGSTRTYGELAAAVNRPGGAQAVGQACGANPIPVLTPCHRAVAAGGKLGGFSGGLDWKRRLLEREARAR